MKYIYVLILLSVVFCSNVLAQTQPEKAKALLDEAQIKYKGPVCMAILNDPNGLPILLSADSIAKAENDIEGRAVINEEIGDFYYSRNADKSIRYLQNAHDLYVKSGNNKKAALSLQNIAFCYEEHKKDIPQAIKYTKLAIVARQQLNDTLGMANMYKYLGLLQGKIGKLNEAKSNVAIAIAFFTAKKFTAGLGVSYRDMANIYKQAHNIDSDIYYLIKAKDIWKSLSDNDDRILGLNSELLAAYTLSNKLGLANNVFLENNAIIADTTASLHYQTKLLFYKNSGIFLIKKKDANMAKYYKLKYAILKDSLRKQGVLVD